MGSIWTIARHTISESIRSKVALSFIILLGVILLGLPFASKGDNTVSGAVQAFLQYSVTSVVVFLSFLSIFLAKPISDDLSGKQILMLMTKPLGRWHYVLGRWLGIVCLNAMLLSVGGAMIYGLTMYLASKPPMDELDAKRLKTQVLQARHASNVITPSFAAAANAQYQKNVEVGKYSGLEYHNKTAEKERIRTQLRERWRVVWPLEVRVFNFEDVRCDKKPETMIHLRYAHTVSNYPPDEIVKYSWIFGSQEKGTKVYVAPRRDYIDRIHTVSVPADCVAKDNTLRVVFENVNPYIQFGEAQHANTVVFKGADSIQVFFSVGTFGGNLMRALGLVMCKLAFLSAVAVAFTTVFSFPVACLGAFSVLLLASTRSFILDSVSWVPEEGTLGVVQWMLNNMIRIVYFILPDFASFNALELLVDGRNITLMWLLMGIGSLVLIKTSILLLAGCLLFMRREVDEVSF
ncbi:MAG: ABC transporter permease [Planctomycetes bacterium]|nr:ABC transporter permease [Planctomycetota bacterium]